MLKPSPRLEVRILGSVLALAVLALYARSAQFEFVLFDDPTYVYENPHVVGGLTWEGVVWVFTHSHGANWHPLTGLSHMLDCQFFGLNPRWHHLSSAVIHALNSALLLLVLHYLTGSMGRSLFVAALFALHPLRVESVAWVSERKDVLCGLFTFLAIGAYGRYARRPTRSAYLTALLVSVLALMSKPMAVTLPFLLLLVDFWPLRRFMPPADQPPGDLVPVRRLLIEKIPFFLCAFAAGVIALCIQGGSAATMVEIPLWLRIENAVLSYCRYIGKMIWPTNLAFLYPYPDSIPWWQSVCALAVLVGVTILVLRTARRWPYLTVGWLWYLVTLAPVIGLIQVGRQSSADRYTYLPHIGLFIMMSWGINDLLFRWRASRAVVAATAVTCACALAGITWHQLGFWENNTALFERALQVTEKNSLAHHNLAYVLLKQGKTAESIAHLQKAVAYKPNYEEAHHNLGLALMLQGRMEEALVHYALAVQFNPRSADWRNDYGLVLVRVGKESEAVVQFLEAIRTEPTFAEAHNNLGVALANQGKLDEAIQHFQSAIDATPNYKEAQENLHKALSSRSQPNSR